jgi:hypothetical protein
MVRRWVLLLILSCVMSWCQAVNRNILNPPSPPPRTCDSEVAVVPAPGVAGVPTNATTAPDGAPEPTACGAYRPTRCGMGVMAAIFFVWPAMGVVAVLSLVVIASMHTARRRRARDLAEATPELTTLLVVERLARVMLRVHGVVIALAIGGVSALVVAELPPLPVVVMALAGGRAVHGWLAARRVLQMVEQGTSRPEIRGLRVAIRGGDREAHLDAWPRALARARRHAIPTSIARHG